MRDNQRGIRELGSYCGGKKKIIQKQSGGNMEWFGPSSLGADPSSAQRLQRKMGHGCKKASLSNRDLTKQLFHWIQFVMKETSIKNPLDLNNKVYEFAVGIQILKQCTNSRAVPPLTNSTSCSSWSPASHTSSRPHLQVSPSHLPLAVGGKASFLTAPC